MPIIELTTTIKADRQFCFDLARNIEFHQKSTVGTKEKAIGGVTKGLIEMGETVTWEATHFGIRQKLTSKITAFENGYHFRDEQISGPFKSLKHDHYFKADQGATHMTDRFEFESPGGIIGRLFNKLILGRYMYDFLVKRNACLKQFAEKRAPSDSH